MPGSPNHQASSEPWCPAGGRERLGFLAVAALALLGGVAVLTAPFLPYQDLPAHGAILRVLSDPQTYAAWFQPGAWLVHSRLAYALGGLLVPVLGIDGAIALLVALAVAGLPLAAWVLGRQVRGSGALPGLVGAAVAFHAAIGMGFLPWSLSLVAALAGAACVVRAMDRWTGSGAPSLVAAVLAVVTYGLHYFGFLLFALLAGSWTITMGRGRQRWSVAIAAVVPGIAGFLLGRLADAGAVAPVAGGAWVFDLGQRLASMAGALTLGSRPALDDGVAWGLIGLVLGVVAIGIATGGLREGKGRQVWALAATVAFGVAWVMLPDFVESPRIVMAGTRLGPVVLVLGAVAARPDGPLARRASLVAGVLAFLAIGFAATATHLDGASLLPQARQFERLPVGSVVASAAAHRPPYGALLTNYAGIHLPARHLSSGRGVTVFPFLHDDSPIRLHPRVRDDVQELYRDLPTFLARAGAWADQVAGEFGDEPRVAQAMAATGWVPLPEAGVGDWRLWERESGTGTEN